MKYLQRSAAIATTATLIGSATFASAAFGPTAVAAPASATYIAWANDAAVGLDNEIPQAPDNAIAPGEPTELHPQNPQMPQPEAAPAPPSPQAPDAAESAAEIRNTDTCAFSQTPPPPVDTSEEPAPGQPSPDPLPVLTPLAGGSNMDTCGIAKAADFAVPDNVTGSGWVVFDIDSGDVIAAKDPHGRYRPASVIKVLLAMVALDELSLDQRFPATFDDASIEGSRAGLVEGNEYPVRLLLQALLMNSGNDAANVLIRALGGQDATVAKVNAKAKSLGATGTRVVNPSGLDAPGQVTSAFDLALFYRAAFNNPEFVELDTTRQVTMPGNEEQGLPDFEMGNDNQLIGSEYPGATGGKTGYTDDARHTFAGAADQGGRRLAVTLVDATIANGSRAWQQAASLLDAGFATKSAAIGSLNELPKPENAHEAEPSQFSAEGEKENTDPNSFFSSLDKWERIGIGVGVGLAVILLVSLTFRAGRRR